MARSVYAGVYLVVPLGQLVEHGGFVVVISRANDVNQCVGQGVNSIHITRRGISVNGTYQIYVYIYIYIYIHIFTYIYTCLCVCVVGQKWESGEARL
jgi:hypothetical protein